MLTNIQGALRFFFLRFFVNNLECFFFYFICVRHDTDVDTYAYYLFAINYNDVCFEIIQSWKLAWSRENLKEKSAQTAIGLINIFWDYEAMKILLWFAQNGMASILNCQWQCLANGNVLYDLYTMRAHTHTHTYMQHLQCGRMQNLSLCQRRQRLDDVHPCKQQSLLSRLTRFH